MVHSIALANKDLLEMASTAVSYSEYDPDLSLLVLHYNKLVRTMKYFSLVGILVKVKLAYATTMYMNSYVMTFGMNWMLKLSVGS